MAHNKKKQKRKGRVLKTTLSERKNKKKKRNEKGSEMVFFFNLLKEIHLFLITHPIPACMIAYTLKIKLIKEKNKHKKKRFLSLSHQAVPGILH